MSYAQDHPRLKALEDYWWSVKPAHGLPGRQHIDPLEIPKLLPWLYLIDVMPSGATTTGRSRHCFRVRLFGTGLVEMFQRDVTGRWLDGLYPEPHCSQMAAAYEQVIDARRPLRAAFTMPVEGREFVRFSRVACPLAADGERIDMLIGVHIYQR